SGSASGCAGIGVALCQLSTASGSTRVSCAPTAAGNSGRPRFCLGESVSAPTAASPKATPRAKITEPVIQKPNRCIVPPQRPVSLGGQCNYANLKNHKEPAG